MGFVESKSTSRRTFLKGMAAFGAAGIVAGCSKNDSDTIIGGGSVDLPGSVYPDDFDPDKAYQAYVACPHNCGPAYRCVSKAWVQNGRVVRVTTDDFEVSREIKDRLNDPRALSCAKGHAYRYRLYHTGRLKYPMKQTVRRGDMTGFVRISWEQAYEEVIRKYRAIYGKYGPAAIQSGSNNSSTGTFASASNALAPITGLGAARSSYGNHSFHQYMYASHMAGIPGSLSWSGSAMLSHMPTIASGVIKNWVSFGANGMSTNNTLSYPYLRAFQLAREKNPNFKHYVISPELTDTGVVTATDWVQLRNLTDGALIAAMIHEMIVRTFDEQGNVRSDAWLDVNYIDTVLYGFFDSPEYWICDNRNDPDAGKISLQPVDGWKKINAVPSGMSYASWIMGSDNRLVNATYGKAAKYGQPATANNYTAKQYISDGVDKPRAALCAMPVEGTPAYQANPNNTSYHTKKNYMEPKTPEWAEKICGTPANVIRELAALYAKEENHPIFTEWTGGLQKAENGVPTLFAIQTLFALTKTWGWTHGSTGAMYVAYGGSLSSLGSAPSQDALPGMPSVAGATSLISNAGEGSSNPSSTPAMSCKEHFNGLYFAFKDQLDANGFQGKADPAWDGTTRYLNDDAGAKTQILYSRVEAGNALAPQYEDSDGRLYNDFVGRDTSGAGNHTPVYVGKRMYIGCAGTQFNQIANPNWQAEIFEYLDLAQDNPDDPETFCFVVCEPYLSPQARFADYVFPLANALEAPDSTSIGGAGTFRRTGLSTPPGEAKDSWDAGFIGWNVQSKLGTYTAQRLDGARDYNKEIVQDAGYAYIGSSNGTYISANEKYRELLVAESRNGSSTYYGMTPEQMIQAQIRAKIPVATPTVDESAVGFTAMRRGLNEYLEGPMDTPFITFVSNSTLFSPSIDNGGMGMNTYTTGAAETLPNAHGRMTCYAEYAVRRWEIAYDVHHGWLPLNERGQKNVDKGGVDPMLYPIPLYYHFEDAFNEMYGVFNPNPNRRNYNDGWYMIGQKPATNDLSLIKDKLTVTVGSTHDRYRSHSSQAENPYLRELNHRTKGGGWLSGNDWNEYSVIPDDAVQDEKAGVNPMISTAVQKRDMATASWHEFWLNDEDADQFDIKDGDLLRVSNPVGAIRVIARVTSRIVRGHGQIHQGAWYDPNPVDGVDDGACANTIMSNRPSKFDNGNAIHCAYCVVEKETSF